MSMSVMGAWWVVLMAVAAVALIFVVLPAATEAYFRYRDPRVVRCPESGLNAVISLDAWHAAATAVPGPPGIHVARCSRRPEGENCSEACVGGGGA